MQRRVGARGREGERQETLHQLDCFHLVLSTVKAMEHCYLLSPIEPWSWQSPSRRVCRKMAFGLSFDQWVNMLYQGIIQAPPIGATGPACLIHQHHSAPTFSSSWSSQPRSECLMCRVLWKCLEWGEVHDQLEGPIQS